MKHSHVLTRNVFSSLYNYYLCTICWCERTSNRIHKSSTFLFKHHNHNRKLYSIHCTDNNWIKSALLTPTCIQIIISILLLLFLVSLTLFLLHQNSSQTLCLLLCKSSFFVLYFKFSIYFYLVIWTQSNEVSVCGQAVHQKVNVFISREKERDAITCWYSLDENIRIITIMTIINTIKIPLSQIVIYK